MGWHVKGVRLVAEMKSGSWRCWLLCLLVISLVLVALLFVGLIAFPEVDVIFPLVLEVYMLGGMIGVAVMT